MCIEARFLAVTENFLEDIGLDLDLSYNTGGNWGVVKMNQDSYLAGESVPSGVTGSLGGITPAASVSAGYGSVLDDLQASLLVRGHKRGPTRSHYRRRG